VMLLLSLLSLHEESMDADTATATENFLINIP